MESEKITLAAVLAARKRIAPYLVPTPTHRYPGLDDFFGCAVYIKHENHQPTGAFKVRGGINLCAALPEAQRKRGVVAASTGNHGQSIARGAQLFDIPAKIFVPEGANPDKVRAIESYGGEIIYHGANYEVCRLAAERYADEHGMRFVSAGNEPMLIAGVGTYALELLEAEPELDAIFVPVGGGSGASGCCIVGHAVNPKIQIIGVQSSHAPSVHDSWKSGQWVTTESADTFAEGLATLSPFELPLHILRQQLDDFVLVDDRALRTAIRQIFAHTHNIAEGAGAASFAAAYQMRRQWQGKKIGLIMSGGNLTLEVLREILREENGG